MFGHRTVLTTANTPRLIVIRSVEYSTQQPRVSVLRQETLETVSIAEPQQNRQHAPLMLSTLGSKEKREGG